MASLWSPRRSGSSRPAIGWRRIRTAGSAAVEAETEAATERDRAREAMMRDLEAARSAADPAFRQYNVADPENRLVAAELEPR